MERGLGKEMQGDLRETREQALPWNYVNAKGILRSLAGDIRPWWRCQAVAEVPRQHRAVP